MHDWFCLKLGTNIASLCIFPNSSPVNPKCCWLSFILRCFCSRPLPGVYHQLYNRGSNSDRAVLDKATIEVRLFSDTSDFNASVALIVTWDRVKQRTVLSTQVSIFHNFWCHFYLKAHKGAEKLTCSFTLSGTAGLDLLPTHILWNEGTRSDPMIKQIFVGCCFLVVVVVVVSLGDHSWQIRSLCLGIHPVCQNCCVAVGILYGFL